MFRRIPAALALLIAIGFSASAVCQAATPDGFIRDIGDRALASLSDKGISDSERVSRFRKILVEAFDLPLIGRFVLGRYWRTTPDAQREEFLNLFEEFIVQAYSNRLKEYTGEKLKILQTRDLSEKESIVMTEVEIPNKPAARINWRVRGEKPDFKIVDVLVEGVSMSVTQRDEFAAVIRESGGKVDGLIQALRKKTSATH